MEEPPTKGLTDMSDVALLERAQQLIAEHDRIKAEEIASLPPW